MRPSARIVINTCHGPRRLLMTRLSFTSIGSSVRAGLKTKSRLAIVIGLAGLIVFPALAAGADPEMDASLTAAFGHLGLNEYDSMEIIDTSLTIEDVTSFRYAANLDPATITEEEAGWGIPYRIGVTWATWTDPSTIPSFPDSPQVVDGALYLPHGGPLPDTSYALMWAQMKGQIPVEDPMELFQNWSFPFGIPGQPTWNPFSDFPQDTWGGASVIPYITYGPQPWGFFMSVVHEDGSLQNADFTGFALIYNDMIIVGVDEHTMFPDGIDGITYSFAGHIHDGTYGSCADCRSLVTFATGTPGTLAAAPPTGTLVVGSGTPPPSTTTTTLATTTTVAESDSATSTAATTSATPAEATGETETESGGFLWWILIIFGLILVFGGLWIWLWPRLFGGDDDDGDDPSAELHPPGEGDPSVPADTEDDPFGPPSTPQPAPTEPSAELHPPGEGDPSVPADTEDDD